MSQTFRVSAAVLTLASVLSFANVASAQEAAPAAPAVAAPGAPGAGPVDKDKDKAEEGRLRIGFNFLNAGVGSAGDLSGPFIGATFKIGWQLDRLMGIYGNISPFVWIGSSSTAGSNASVGAISGTQLTPLFSLTPADIFEVAAGPSLDYLTGGGVEVKTANGGTITAGGFSSVYLGLHGKAALHLGGRNEETGRRRGFTLEANVHPSFTPDNTALFITGGLGYDWL
jgi:hypothetical protein